MPNFKFPNISSFFVALILYNVIIVSIFIKLAVFSEPAKRYTDDKDAFMDVVVVEREIAQEIKAPKQKEEIKKELDVEHKKDEIKEEKIATTQKDVAKPQHEPKQEFPKPELPQAPDDKPEAQIVQKEETKPKKLDLKNLFSDIDTSKLKDDKKTSENKVQSRKKDEKKIETKSSEASDIIKNLKIDKVSATPKSQTTGTYDPLKGAITKQIERRWRSYKANSDSIAKIKIMIDGSGNFSYEMMELSRDNEFNQKAKECLDALTLEKFPYSPSGAITFNLNLEDKLEIQ